MTKINTALNKMTRSLWKQRLETDRFRKSLILRQCKVQCCSSAKTTNGPRKLFHATSSTEVAAARETPSVSADGHKESITPVLTSRTWSS